MYFYLDFETRSRLDLRKVGADNYASDPSTKVISIAWADGDSPVCHSVNPPDFVPSRIFVAHNCEFEAAILKYKYEFEPKAWVDTMALAAHMSLPLSLERLAEFFGLSKDMTGHRVMMKLSRPRRPSKDNPDEFWERDTKPEDFDLLDEYNENDVEVMRKCHKMMVELPSREQRIFGLTRQMNTRGVQVHVSAVIASHELVQAEATALNAKVMSITGVSAKSSKRLSAWAGLPNVKKESVAKALETTTLSSSIRQVLEMRQTLGRSSVGKLQALRQRTSSDGYLRGSLVYAGAQRTGRWSSRGVQLQNLPRGLGEFTDDAFVWLQQGRLRGALKLMPEMLRGFFLGPFIVGDYRQIEARILAWLAKDVRQVQAWASGADLYKEMAAYIYNVPEGKVTDEQRRIGKATILGCGYQMGPDKFVGAMAIQGRTITSSFALRAVQAYRDRHPAIVRLWYSLGDTFNRALRSNGPHHHPSGVTCERQSVHGIRYCVVTLPSGRRMYYANPHTDSSGELRVYSPNPREPHGTKIYGGRLTENVTQALARDLMADAMLRMDERQFQLVLTVHDEIVSLDDGRVEEFTRLMKQTPRWAKGLPVDVEVFQCARYRK